MKKAIICLALAGAVVSCTADEKANVAPSVTKVAINGGPFFNASVIAATPLGWSDPDGDPPKYSYQWNVNGKPFDGATGDTFSPSGLAKGDQITVDVTPRDRFSAGKTVRSNEVYIFGSLPRVYNVLISKGPFYAGTPVSVEVVAQDDDGDPFNLDFTWFVNGEEVVGVNSPTLDVELKRGDRVRARVTPYETFTEKPLNFSSAGESDEPIRLAANPVDSNEVTIVNTPPQPPEVAVYPTGATTGTPLWAVVESDSIDADGDSVHYTYDWYKNGELQEFSIDTTYIAGDFVEGGDQWVVAVTPSDSYDLGWSALAPGPMVVIAGEEKLGGAYHTCVRLMTTEALKCWGLNNFGQLGDGTTTNRNAPVLVRPGGTVGVTKLALGNYFSCVLLADNTVRCWGQNESGQLGRGTTSTYQTDFVNVAGLPATTFNAISSGEHHTCVKTTAGAVYCWGSNSDGQLGDGSTNNSTTAKLVSGVTAAGISAGSSGTCAITTAGGITCWGRYNGAGATLSPVSIAASGYSTAAGSIALGGDHGCARSTTNQLKCWGVGFGATPVVVEPTTLGNGTVSSSGTTLTFTVAQSFAVGTDIKVGSQTSTITSGSGTSWQVSPAFSPALIAGSAFTYTGPVSVLSITSGLSHTCVLTSTYGVKCFGLNDRGQLGNAQLANFASTQLVDVTGFESGGAKVVSAGVNHTCALKGASTGQSGILLCWGDNTYGQLGNGIGGVLQNIPVATKSWAVAADGGDDTSCVLTVDARVACWGDNTHGQLGDGTTTDRSTAVTVLDNATNLPLSDVVALSVGGQHACALRSSGAAVCWGRGVEGQLGNAANTNYTKAVAVSGGFTFAAIAAGSTHTCGISSIGEVKCWGRNATGALGSSFPTDRNAPGASIALAGGAKAMQIAAGRGHTCAVTTGGSVQCWGANDEGQLGLGDTTRRTTPTVVNAGWATAVRVATHDAHTCAQFVSRNTYCWGRNRDGQLGLGHSNTTLSPTIVGAVNGVGMSLAVGYDHTCILTVTGGMTCWGRNRDGEVGVGNTGLQLNPVSVANASAGVMGIAAGGSHTCAIVNGGLVKCWGRNDDGQLGYGVMGAGSVTTDRLQPTAVSGHGSLVSVIGAGSFHTCDVYNGAAYCWGRGLNGQIGDAASVNRATPAQVAGPLANVTIITGGDDFTCARLSDSSVRCWTTSPNKPGTWNGSSCPAGNTPQVTNLSGYAINTLSAGREHVCAGTTANTLLCWGEGGSGRLGFGTQDPHCLPQTPVGIRGNTENVNANGAYTTFTGGDNTMCAVATRGATSGYVRCWGGNWECQLGDNTTTERWLPTLVAGGTTNNYGIGVGAHHACIIKTGSPYLQCWGWNPYGAVGNASWGNRLCVPTNVSGITAVPKQVAGGYAHTCAIYSNNALYCWGWANEYQTGQRPGATNCGPQSCNAHDCNCDWLGCDTCYDRCDYCYTTPVQVGALGTTVKAVSSRDTTTCAIRNDGATDRVYCWGRNGNGQVGNNSTAGPVGTPTAINLTNFTNPALLVASGGTFSCAKDSSAAPAIKCWGRNSWGQLGDATTTQRAYPGAVQGLAGLTITQLVAGDNHACALTTTGRVYCWGENGCGQIGQGTIGSGCSNGSSYYTTAQSVKHPYGPSGAPLDSVINISAGRNETCAALSTGETFCWGNNSNGQVGDNTNANRSLPAVIAGLNPATERGYAASVRNVSSNVAAGGAHTCFIVSTGVVRCYGDNSAGQLGDNSTTTSFTQRNVVSTSLNNAVAVAAGNKHSCAIQSGGTVWCWGENADGQLGASFPNNQLAPVQVAGITSASRIFAGWAHTCVILTDTSARCWGRNAENQLGTNAATLVQPTPVPLQISGVTITGIQDLALGAGHTCIRDTDRVRCLGANAYGQVGDSTTSSLLSSPVDTVLNAGLAYSQADFGENHGCGVLTNGTIRCWGMSNDGEVGDGSSLSYVRGQATPVYGISAGATKVVVGWSHSCALVAGEVKCWGDNLYGQIGPNGGVRKASPVSVPLGGELAIDITAGIYHSCALLATSKTVKCWGTNYTGQLGAGNALMGSGKIETPVAVVDSGGTPIANVASLGSGWYHSCAVSATGALSCWGSNANGQLALGAGDVGQYRGYAQTSGSISGVTMVHGGENHSCARTSAGQLLCWGADDIGQIGNDATTGGNIVTPTYVSGFSASGASKFAVGRNHACVLATSGRVSCWGENYFGQLGDGTTTQIQPVPVTVQTRAGGPSRNVLDVMAGGTRSCAIDWSNNLLCWGDSQSGAFGNLAPRPVGLY